MLFIARPGAEKSENEVVNRCVVITRHGKHRSVQIGQKRRRCGEFLSASALGQIAGYHRQIGLSLLQRAGEGGESGFVGPAEMKVGEMCDLDHRSNTREIAFRFYPNPCFGLFLLREGAGTPGRWKCCPKPDSGRMTSVFTS